MSRWLRIRDGRGRDARVRMEPARRRDRPKLRTLDGRSAAPVRFIKSPPARTYAALRSRCPDDAALAELIIEEDAEIDFEAAGRRTGPTDRVLLDPDGNVLYAAAEVEVVCDRRGIEVERRAPVDVPANVDGKVVVVEAQAAVIRTIFEWRAEGRSLRRMVKDLNDKGVLAHRGGKWRTSAVWRLYRNRFYTGQSRSNGGWVEGQHEAIVSDDLFTRANVRNHKAGRGRRKTGSSLKSRRPGAQASRSPCP